LLLSITPFSAELFHEFAAVEALVPPDSKSDIFPPFSIFLYKVAHGTPHSFRPRYSLLLAQAGKRAKLFLGQIDYGSHE
jgi:hypothetical protein